MNQRPTRLNQSLPLFNVLQILLRSRDKIISANNVNLIKYT